MRSAALVLLLAGCAVEPATIIREPVEVRVAVPVACQVPAVERPAWATEAIEAAEPRVVIRGGRALMAEVEQRRAYEARLEAALDACRKTPAQ